MNPPRIIICIHMTEVYSQFQLIDRFSGRQLLFKFTVTIIICDYLPQQAAVFNEKALKSLCALSKATDG